VEPRAHGTEVPLRNVADRTVGERVVERAELGLAFRRRAGAGALVQHHKAPVLQVVDPALWDDAVAGAGDARRDRARSGPVDVGPRCWGAIGVGDEVAEIDVGPT